MRLFLIFSCATVRNAEVHMQVESGDDEATDVIQPSRRYHPVSDLA
jgi:hypothetical protein